MMGSVRGSGSAFGTALDPGLRPPGQINHSEKLVFAAKYSSLNWRHFYVIWTEKLMLGSECGSGSAFGSALEPRCCPLGYIITHGKIIIFSQIFQLQYSTFLRTVFYANIYILNLRHCYDVICTEKLMLGSECESGSASGSAMEPGHRPPG
jgi:hypothetical protein